MGILLRISLRNLFRQKRRNLLLGAAIAIGMAILVMANAFSHGVSDVLFNRLLALMSGHVSVSFTQNGNRLQQIFRDGDRMKALVQKTVPELSTVQEAVGIFARVIGNARNDNAILVGMHIPNQADEKQTADIRENFRMVEGSYEDLFRKDLENPVIMAVEKARSLNVGLHDVVRVRFQDVHGQNQAARLTVVGIFIPANVFMNAPVFLDIRELRRIAGYGPHDIGQLYVMLPDPKKNAIQVADALHAALKPSLAAASGNLEYNGRTTPATALGFRVDSASLIGLEKILPGFTKERHLKSNDVLLGKKLADSLNLKNGDRFTLSYVSKYDETKNARISLIVTGVLPPLTALPDRVVLVNDRDFYGFFYDHWPEIPEGDALTPIPDSTSSLYPFLCREWILMKRAHTTQEMQRDLKLLPQLKSHAVAVNVPTMYESASMIINLEYALNLITLGAVLILFFIIQVGVINTLRMTIRERTREIGTMRAMGMQKHLVRNMFLLESFFLAFFACLFGIILAFIAMWLLSGISIASNGNHWDMLLVNGHLHFKPSALGIALFMPLILAITVVTAWFPSRTAANLSPSDALGHFG